MDPIAVDNQKSACSCSDGVEEKSHCTECLLLLTGECMCSDTLEKANVQCVCADRESVHAV